MYNSSITHPASIIIGKTKSTSIHTASIVITRRRRTNKRKRCLTKK